MDTSKIVEMQTEQTILGHVRAALDAAMKAKLTETTAERWHERICFLTDSFARHLDRLFGIEEADAYSELFLECPSPGIAENAERLRGEHRILRSQLQNHLREARSCNPANLANLHKIRQCLHGFLLRLNKHHRKESELWQELYMVDIGGEG